MPPWPVSCVGRDMISSEFYTDAFRPADRFDAAEAAASAWTSLRPVEGAGFAEVSWRQWEFDGLAVYDTEFSPLRFERLDKRFNPYDHEYLLLQIYGQGDSRVTIGDEVVRHDRWTIFLFDMSRRYSNTANAVKTRGVLIPHAMVGYDPSRHPPAISLAPKSPQGRVLLETFWTLPDRLPSLVQGDTERAVAELADLVRALMLDPLGLTESRAVRRARRAAMETFIALRLHDPDLRPETLCRAFGVSRASLYRLFEETGGVAGHLRDRRLEAARWELSRAESSRGVIRGVAERWGFVDPADFHHAFKRRFDAKPSEAVGLNPAAATEPVSKSPGAFLRDWARKTRATAGRDAGDGALEGGGPAARSVAA
ncbi:MAG: helix-turn-helix transcriptional regulator [Pseudomonadota bacterium]